jgi:hypothetical protein
MLPLCRDLVQSICVVALGTSAMGERDICQCHVFPLLLLPLTACAQCCLLPCRVPSCGNFLGG